MSKTITSEQENQDIALTEDQKNLAKLCLEAKQNSALLVGLSSDVRNKALHAMADAIDQQTDDIRFKNDIDVEAGKSAGLSTALLDRLTLTTERIKSMAQGLREMAALSDPVGETLEEQRHDNGMIIQKQRVPLGVIGIIYESRPNVTVDCAGLCLKSGNAVVLRGGKEALNSNTALVHILQNALEGAGVPRGIIQLVESTDRALIRDFVRMDKLIDLIIPRGGEALVKAVRDMATVPVLSHGKGLCSVYVDKEADLKMAEDIAFNAKVQRPGVCNAMETLLVHESIAKTFLPAMVERWKKAGVDVRGDEKVFDIVGSQVTQASAEDWDTEYLSLTAAVHVVSNLEDAVHHINRHGSHHSDAIITQNQATADQFLNTVDSAAVFHNASTRLHDGSVFGLGAEMGISTQKMHARGTMGLRELTTTKYVVRGTGQIRE